MSAFSSIEVAELARESPVVGVGDAAALPGLRSLRLRFLEMAATGLVAVCLGFLFQLAVTLASFGFAAKQNTQFDTTLFDADRSPLSGATLLAHNLLPLTAFVLCGLLLAGWRPHPRVVLSRWSVALITVGFIGYCFQQLAMQEASIAAERSVPRIAMLLLLPHGPLEFGGFFVPLIAARWPRSKVARSRIEHVRRSLPLALALIVLAAFVECWITPVLLSLQAG